MKKNLWTYLVVAIFIVVIASLYVTSGGEKGTDIKANTSTSSASVLTATTEMFDFGTIMMQDGNVEHEFMVENLGEEPVVISKVYTSCMCTQAMITSALGEQYGAFGMPGHGGSGKTNIIVPAGERIVVNAIFDPAAHGPAGVGKADRTVYLETNSTVEPKVQVHFTSTVAR